MSSQVKVGSLFILMILVVACSKDQNMKIMSSGNLSNTIPVEDCDLDTADPCHSNKNKVNIRLQNLSKYDLCNVTYTPDQLPKNYGNIEAGGCTCFMDFERAFSYPVEFALTFADTSVFTFAIDLVGAGILSPGYYNYNVSLFNADRIYINGLIVPAEDDVPFSLDNSFNCPDQPAVECGLDTQKVNLRFVNESIFDLCRITYENDEGQVIEFGNVARGTPSCYVPIDLIDEYRFRLMLQIGDRTLEVDRLAPLSIEGQIEKGKYSIYIGLQTLRENGLITHFVEDL